MTRKDMVYKRRLLLSIYYVKFICGKKYSMYIEFGTIRGFECSLKGLENIICGWRGFIIFHNHLFFSFFFGNLEQIIVLFPDLVLFAKTKNDVMHNCVVLFVWAPICLSKSYLSMQPFRTPRKVLGTFLKEDKKKKKDTFARTERQTNKKHKRYL